MTAQITVTGITSRLLSVSFKIVATAIAPKAVCESPSPINENLFNTSVTPKSDDAREIKTAGNLLQIGVADLFRANLQNAEHFVSVVLNGK